MTLTKIAATAAVAMLSLAGVAGQAKADQGIVVATHWGTQGQCFSFSLLDPRDSVVTTYAISLFVASGAPSPVALGEADQIANASAGRLFGLTPTGSFITCQNGQQLPTFTALNSPPTPGQ